MRHSGPLWWLFRVWNLWSITLEGELTWWCMDDDHLRKRKLDYEFRPPKWAWRPYCWLRRQHDPYYSECIYCGKYLGPRRG